MNLPVNGSPLPPYLSRIGGRLSRYCGRYCRTICGGCVAPNDGISHLGVEPRGKGKTTRYGHKPRPTDKVREFRNVPWWCRVWSHPWMLTAKARRFFRVSQSSHVTVGFAVWRTCCQAGTLAGLLFGCEQNCTVHRALTLIGFRRGLTVGHLLGLAQFR